MKNNTIYNGTPPPPAMIQCTSCGSHVLEHNSVKHHDEWFCTVCNSTEVDPYGKSQHESGAKLDHNKPRMSLVLGEFSRALTEVAKVGTYGAEKYSDNGWLEVPNGQERYTDAHLRHLLTSLGGENFDKDTDLLHLAHSAWNALAILELELRK